MAFEKITLVSRSAEGFDAAIDDMINRAEEALASVHWVEVKELGVELASVETQEYQAEVEITFELEGEDGE